MSNKDFIINDGMLEQYVGHGLDVVIPNDVTYIGEGAFECCSKLTSMTYVGTKEQWNTIESDAIWDTWSSHHVVHCTDGDIAKSE